MTYDEFVQQPQIIDDRIQHALTRAERLRDLCDRVTTVYGDRIKVQTSRENKREKWLVEYADSMAIVYDLMEQRDAAADSVRKWLYESMEYKGASLLEYRYCDCMSNKEIAASTGYVEQTIKNKISKAEREARTLYERGQ